jgi:molybdate transport system substrate-binding protein
VLSMRQSVVGWKPQFYEPRLSVTMRLQRKPMQSLHRVMHWPGRTATDAKESHMMRRRGLVGATFGYSVGRGLGLGSGLVGLGTVAQAQNLPTPLMQQIRVSAASDLKFALADVLNQFQRDTGLPVIATYGSSGQFARQIAQGLPTDLFMSADEALVTQLADKGLTQGIGAVYAVGRLALVVPRTSKLVTEGDWQAVQASLRLGLGVGKEGSAASSIQKFAIANPEHAPYGRAAKEALTAMDLWRAAQGRLVMGENIAQATQYVATGAAQAGLTALSLAIAPEVAATTRYAAVPAPLHAPLRQRMVLLKNARPQARELFDYLQTDAIRKRLQSMGFGPA